MLSVSVRSRDDEKTTFSGDLAWNPPQPPTIELDVMCVFLLS